MRLSNVILVLALGGSATGLGIVGCGGESTTGGSGGGSSSSSGSSSSTGPACAPGAACTTVKSDCVALKDNAGQAKFAMRMAQLDITAPVGLTGPLIKGVVSSGVAMNLPKCNLGGTGTFNLIMSFDTGAKTFTVGGAHPAADPTKGYTFVNETVQGIPIAPKTGAYTVDAAGKFTPMDGVDIVLPIYLKVTDAMPSVLLPLHKATIVGTLSTDQNCVGKYNATTLDPAAGCAGSDKNPAFTTGADLSGYMTLEEADTVVVDTLGQSLCVIITGDATTYGDMGTPIKCKRDATMKIVYKGDWCAATNKAADAACFDAASLAGKLAASAVLLNP
jgi:hypothetical protein